MPNWHIFSRKRRKLAYNRKRLKGVGRNILPSCFHCSRHLWPFLAQYIRRRRRRTFQPYPRDWLVAMCYLSTHLGVTGIQQSQAIWQYQAKSTGEINITIPTTPSAVYLFPTIFQTCSLGGRGTIYEVIKSSQLRKKGYLDSPHTYTDFYTDYLQQNF